MELEEFEMADAALARKRRQRKLDAIRTRKLKSITDTKASGMNNSTGLITTGLMTDVDASNTFMSYASDDEEEQNEEDKSAFSGLYTRLDWLVRKPQ